MTFRPLAVLLTLCGALACSEPAPALETEPPPPETPKVAMAGLVDAMSTLIPLSLVDGEFEDPARRSVIEGSLSSLTRHAEALRTFAFGEDEGMAWLSRALAADVAEAQASFTQRRYPQARFRVQRLIADCVACHSRLPDPGHSAIGAQLLAKVDVSTLDPEEVAQLQMATRQWEAAADTYEGLLLARPADGDLGGVWVLGDFLVVTVRVLRDPARAMRVLTLYSEAPALPRLVREDVRRWLVDLATAKGGPLPARDTLLQRARDHVDAAQRAGEGPSGQGSLVRWILASGDLQGFVEGRSGRSGDLGEAYYLLGLAESHIASGPFVDQPGGYLAASVHAAPSSPFAKKALALLEWRVAVEYTGSGGERVPDDVRAELDTLRALIERGDR